MPGSYRAAVPIAAVGMPSAIRTAPLVQSGGLAAVGCVRWNSSGSMNQWLVETIPPNYSTSNESTRRT